MSERHSAVKRQRLLALGVVAALMVAACGVSSPGDSGVDGIATAATSGSSRPTTAHRPSTAPNAEASPSWPPDLEAQLGCSTGPQDRMPDASGSGPYEAVAEPSIELAFRRFLEIDGSVVGSLPFEGWVTVDGGTGWARFEHRVDGVTKALAYFSAVPEASDTRWSWAVAACDPSEFDPAVRITGPVVVWTDAAGKRMPLSRVRERGLCGGPPATIAVDGRVFAERDGIYPPDRLRSTFARRVRLPANAVATPYRDGKRRIWIAGDATAAYVGTTSKLERWPRLVNDDDSVTDCN
jgi:hypothetical protein